MTHAEAMQAAIKNTIAQIDAGRMVHTPDGKMAYAPTGDYYLTIGSGGIKPEGETIGIWCTTEIIALSAMLGAVLKYKTNHPGTIYWRAKPTVNIENFLKPVQNTSPLAIKNEATLAVYPLFYAWCRIVISDKPVLSDKDLIKLMEGKISDKDAHHHPPQPDTRWGDGKLEGH